MEKLLENMRNFLEEVHYDGFMSQPAWSGHCFTWEYCSHWILICMSFMEVLNLEKYKEAKEELNLLDARVAELGRCEEYPEKEYDVLDQEYLKFFEKVVGFLDGVYLDLGGKEDDF